MKILFIGDIVGRPGREYIVRNLNKIKTENNIDVCIANGENASHGNSITLASAKELWNAGVDVFTMGNHTFNRNVSDVFDDFPHIIRPANFNNNLPGNGSIIYDTGKYRLGVINVQGQVYMDPSNSPFESAVVEYNKINQNCDAILIDFHAEATSEKAALAYFLDGKVSAVVGTHTHVQTADEKILPQGTAFITDVGMTGVYDSILGTKTDIIVNRFAYHKKDKFELAEGKVQFNAVIITVNDSDGKATEIKRINVV